MASFKELLNALQNPTDTPILANTANTWSRIGSKDTFDELELQESELDEFLKEWTSDNEYSNI